MQHAAILSFMSAVQNSKESEESAEKGDRIKGELPRLNVAF